MNEFKMASNTTLNKLEQDVRNLVVKYRNSMHDNELVEAIVKNVFKYLDLDMEIKTEYNDSFCDLFMQYASKYPNANGFWGKYKIDEGIKQEWFDLHPRFKQTVSLIPNITSDLMNQNIILLIDSAAETKDVRTSVQICLKLLDMGYKTEKDSGMIKDRAQEVKIAKKRHDSNISDKDIADIEDFLDS